MYVLPLQANAGISDQDSIQHDPKYINNATNTDPDTSMRPPPPPSATIASLAYFTADDMMDDDPGEGPSNKIQRDNTVAAHAHQFKKVLELSDVIIQVRGLDISIPIRFLD